MSLRERKKAETKRHISEVALGLFVERGFDQVTIAEVAQAADVAANTVYNYFKVKEDLVLPPVSRDRLAAIVRGRGPGQSAADAVLATLRDELRRRDRNLGLAEGFGRFLEMMRAAPTLSARLVTLAEQMVDDLAAVLAEEAGAGPGDPMPALVAEQLGWVHAHVLREIGRRTAEGQDPSAIAIATLERLDVIESLLGERVRTYGSRA
ncbi:TetR/AcrR family transcriptional regulator [Nonomuraea dietziae]|uniref:AcrR family transcriptional regulator n=1 Tax=Nonomuraea dietziae TaxID=65515 RepID=A0A7W5V489_9ACTN|nr:TetR/AcrR family transcriptional regulator [Nonomuraea dietziae]MBB3730272.1 AcrR family transcriptional regulator [Nonomuraea dietziae]